MKLTIQSIHNKGRAADEYVTLKVEESCDVGSFLLADTTYAQDGTVSAKLRHLFWFPDKSVSAGDFIMVFTREGPNGAVRNQAGTMTHHFFWGLKASVWNNAQDCAILFQSPVWTTKRVA